MAKKPVEKKPVDPLKYVTKAQMAEDYDHLTSVYHVLSESHNNLKTLYNGQQLRLAEERDAHVKEVDELIESRAKAVLRVNQYRIMLDLYGQHLSGCKFLASWFRQQGDFPCDCGLHQARGTGK